MPPAMAATTSNRAKARIAKRVAYPGRTLQPFARARCTRKQQAYGISGNSGLTEVACGKRSGEFKLTVRRRSSNKDSNGNQPRRVLDEDDEVPTRLCTGVLLVRTAVQSK